MSIPKAYVQLQGSAEGPISGTGLKIDLNAFNYCLDSATMAATIRQELSEGQSTGVQGTPASFINGKNLEGSLPFPGFQSAIAAAPIIYYIEAHPQFGPIARQVVSAFQSGSLTAYSSVITLTEVLSKPMEMGDEKLDGKFAVS